MATKRLIDANALTDVIEETDWYHISPKGYLEKGANSQIHRPLYKADDIYQALKDAPTVDAVEVVHGRWVWTETGEQDYEQFWVCSKCGDHTYFLTNYCPNCGAKMDGDGNA